MKLLYILLISLLIGIESYGQSVATITDINNHTINLDSMNGKKVLVVVLPLQQDTAIIRQLVRFRQRHADSIKVVGLVCLSNGAISASTIDSLYADAISAGVIVTEGVPASVSPTNARQGVLQWLSAKNRNRQSEPHVTGTKYFLSEQGKMYADGGARMSLDSRMVENILKAHIPGEHN